MKSQKWREKIADKTLTIGDFEDALLEWDQQVQQLEQQVEDLQSDREADSLRMS